MSNEQEDLTNILHVKNAGKGMLQQIFLLNPGVLEMQFFGLTNKPHQLIQWTLYIPTLFSHC